MPTWLHLCPVHPDEAAALVAPSVVVLALLLPGRLRALRLLWVEPLGRGGGDAPHLVDLGTPAAVLHGWLRPTLVVDRGLWRALAPAERQALLAHERGHLARHDPLVRMVLRGLWTLAPAPLAQGAVRAWLDHAERAADAEAGRIVGDPTLVAAAILRCARLGAAGPDLALGWSGGSLADRVHALLEGPAPRSPARPDAGPADLLALALALLLGLSASPWLHHQVEHLLNLSL